MIKVTTLTDSPKQKFSIPLETGEKVAFRFYFDPTQMSWYFDFEINQKQYNGNKVVLGDNILRMYKQLIPFGLQVKANFSIEPFKLDDFSSGRVEIYILSRDDVKYVEGKVFGIDD